MIHNKSLICLPPRVGIITYFTASKTPRVVRCPMISFLPKTERKMLSVKLHHVIIVRPRLMLTALQLEKYALEKRCNVLRERTV